MSNPIERLTNSVIGGDSKKAALIVSETNLYYLTAFPSTDGALLLTSEQAYYLLDFRYTEAARAKAQNVEVVEFTSLNETYKTLLKKHGITEVYMEYAALPYGHAKRFEQLSEECGAKAILNTTLDDATRKQRIVKSDEEVKRICDAQAITDATFEHILPYIKEGVTEREIALEIEFFMRKEGADGNAFNPIVVTGANGSQCHGIPGNTQIKKGDLITMDTGAMLAGYHSDMTRTVALGHATEEMRKVYDTVLRALRDEPGYWWHTYKRAWKQNWKQSLLPGALLGLFVGSWSWMLRAQAAAGNTSTMMWVASLAGIFVCTGFFSWLLAQVPLVDLPLPQLAKNAGLMFFGFFPRTLAAALLLAVYWGLTLLYLPFTIITLLAFGFWLPVVIALMILYPGLDKVFKLEETLSARRDAEIEERIAESQPTFHNK